MTGQRQTEVSARAKQCERLAFRVEEKYKRFKAQSNIGPHLQAALNELNPTHGGSNSLFGGGLKLKTFGDELGFHKPQGLEEMDKSVDSLCEEAVAEQEEEDRAQDERERASAASNTPIPGLVDPDAVLSIRVSNCVSEAPDLKVRLPIKVQDYTLGYDLYQLVKEAMKAYGLNNPDHDVAVEYWANSYCAFIEFDYHNMCEDSTDKDGFISRDDLIQN